jgi:hypothetical protein
VSGLKNGAFYVLGACKRTGDRSYIGHIWEVVEATETHAVIKSLTPTSYGWGKPQLVLVEEFDWADGSKFAKALADEAVR